MGKINIDGILCNLMSAQADAADVFKAAQAAKMTPRDGMVFARAYWKSRYGPEERRLEKFIEAAKRLSVIWQYESEEKVRSAFGQLDHFRGSLARAEANRRSDEEAVVDLVQAYMMLTLAYRKLREQNVRLVQRLLDVEAERATQKPRRNKSRKSRP